jgi:hypothetical protein
MTQAFDTLGFAKTLESAGVARKQAEAHAEAIRDKVMPELATRADIHGLQSDIQKSVAATRTEIQRLETATKAQFQQFEAATKAQYQQLDTAIHKVESSLRADARQFETTTKAEFQRLEALMVATTDKVTIRLGGLVVVVAGLMLAALRLFPA